MGIYKKTMVISGLVVLATICFLALSNGNLGDCVENIAIGLLSSGLLLMFSSAIGYYEEEKRNCKEYYWHLIALRNRGLVLSTIPINKGTYKDYWEALTIINELLEKYFAIFDQDFIFIGRKKIQKILEIHNELCRFKNLSIDAELYIRQYMSGKTDEKGNKIYTKENLMSDIKEFSMAVDDFMGDGKYFVMYLDEKIRELQKII